MRKSRRPQGFHVTGAPRVAIQGWRRSISQERLALTAALGDSSSSRAAWNQLVSETPVESLDHSILRHLPRVARNVGHAQGVHSVEKLQGSYRSNWVTLTAGTATFMKVAEKLEAHAIDYRVIKGFAVSLLEGGIGRRTFGDIDLVIGSQDFHQVEVLLTAHGYSKRLAAQGALSSVWDLPGSLPIDLHVAEEHSGSIGLVLKERPQSVTHLGTMVLVPPRELLITVALWHGKKASSRTDFLQATVDTALLLGGSNEKHLRTLINRFRLNQVVHQVRAEMLDSGLSVEKLPIFSVNQRALANAAERLRAPGAWRLRDAARRIRGRFRRQNCGHRPDFSLCSRVDALIYQLWIALGETRVMERVVCLLRGGLLPQEPDLQVGGPLAEHDFRVALRVSESGDYRVKIWLTSHSHQRNVSHSLFISGRYLASMAPGFTGPLEAETFFEHGAHEFSARPLSGCSNISSLRIELVPRGQWEPVFEKSWVRSDMTQGDQDA